MSLNLNPFIFSNFDKYSQKVNIKDSEAFDKELPLIIEPKKVKSEELSDKVNTVREKGLTFEKKRVFYPTPPTPSLKSRITEGIQHLKQVSKELKATQKEITEYQKIIKDTDTEMKKYTSELEDPKYQLEKNIKEKEKIEKSYERAKYVNEFNKSELDKINKNLGVFKNNLKEASTYLSKFDTTLNSQINNSELSKFKHLAPIQELHEVQQKVLRGYEKIELDKHSKALKEITEAKVFDKTFSKNGLDEESLRKLKDTQSTLESLKNQQPPFSPKGQIQIEFLLRKADKLLSKEETAVAKEETVVESQTSVSPPRVWKAATPSQTKVQEKVNRGRSDSEIDREQEAAREREKAKAVEPPSTKWKRVIPTGYKVPKGPNS